MNLKPCPFPGIVKGDGYVFFGPVANYTIRNEEFADYI
jgi:hypothetical protein